MYKRFAAPCEEDFRRTTGPSWYVDTAIYRIADGGRGQGDITGYTQDDVTCRSLGAVYISGADAQNVSSIPVLVQREGGYLNPCDKRTLDIGSDSKGNGTVHLSKIKSRIPNVAAHCVKRSDCPIWGSVP